MTSKYISLLSIFLIGSVHLHGMQKSYNGVDIVYLDDNFNLVGEIKTFGKPKDMSNVNGMSNSSTSIIAQVSMIRPSERGTMYHLFPFSGPNTNREKVHAAFTQVDTTGNPVVIERTKKAFTFITEIALNTNPNVEAKYRITIEVKPTSEMIK